MSTQNHSLPLDKDVEEMTTEEKKAILDRLEELDGPSAMHVPDLKEGLEHRGDQS